MKNFSRTLAGIMLAAGSSAAFAAADVNIWNWSDYIGENTVADFEKAEKLKANYAVFDSNELVEARLLSGKSGFDTVMMVSYYVPRLAKAGALEKIDKSKIPNWINLDKKRLAALEKIDPNNDYAYPYTEISVGIGYNQDKLKEIFGEDFKFNSWNDLFDQKNAKKISQCGIAVLDSPIEIVSTAMHYLNKDPKSENTKDYDEALELLTKFASNVSYFHSSRYINDLASGEVCAVIGYSGDILQAAQRAKANKVNIEFTIPKEGSIYWYDCWTMAKAGDNYDNAHKWLNFLADSENATKVGNEIRYMMTVTDAIENLDKELKDNPSLNMSEEFFQKMHFLEPITSKQTKITNRVWNAMKLNSNSSSEEDEGSGWD